MGSQLTAVAVPLQIYGLTGSSAYVGLAGLVGFGPMVGGALWGGALADVRDRRRMLLVTNGGIGATSVLLWAQACAQLRSVGVLLLLVGVQQGLFGANAAASGAVVPRLVPARLLPAANALQSMAASAAGITGPLLAGSLLPVVGAQTLYLADALALCATLWAVWRLPPLPPLPAHRGPGKQNRHPGPRDIAEGFRLVARSRILLVAYLADFAALFLGLPDALFPQLARNQAPSGTGAAEVGVLYAALSAGGVLAVLLSGSLTRITRYGAAVAVAVCVWGLAIAGFGLARTPVAAAGLLVLAGGALVVLSVFRKSILQTVATDELRGRIQGADTVVGAGGPRLAGLVHGTAGAAFGTTAAITGGGLLAVAAMLALVTAFPDFRRYRAPSGTRDTAPPATPDTPLTEEAAPPVR